MGKLVKINLIMGALYSIGYEEEKCYNYQCRELQLISKDIMT